MVQFIKYTQKEYSQWLRDDCKTHLKLQIEEEQELHSLNSVGQVTKPHGKVEHIVSTISVGVLFIRLRNEYANTIAPSLSYS